MAWQAERAAGAADEALYTECLLKKEQDQGWQQYLLIQAVSTASATSSCAQTLYESEMGERAVTCLQRPASSLASLHLCVVRPGGW